MSAWALFPLDQRVLAYRLWRLDGSSGGAKSPPPKIIQECNGCLPKSKIYWILMHSYKWAQSRDLEGQGLNLFAFQWDIYFSFRALRFNYEVQAQKVLHLQILLITWPWTNFFFLPPMLLWPVLSSAITISIFCCALLMVECALASPKPGMILFQ